MTDVLDILFVAYFVVYNATQTCLLSLALSEVQRWKALRIPELDTSVLSQQSSPPITIIAPAYNEQTGIVDATRAFLQLEYPNLRVIVVNDGSKDRTLELLKLRFGLRPIDMVYQRALATKPVRTIYQSTVDDRLLVVDKENGGKADALNVGLNVSRTPLVCCVDSDTLIDRRSLLRMSKPFVYDNRNVVCVGGTVRLANGCTVQDGVVKETGIPRSWLARFQTVEYLRAFLFGRMGFNRIGGNLIVSGAFGLFLREAVMEVGGYKAENVGEDMELVVRLHRRMRELKRPYNVIQIPEPVCYTEVPETLRGLGTQRDRWQRGLIDTLLLHVRMLFNPRYGATGMVVYPMFVLFELVGPVVELLGYAWYGYLLATGRATNLYSIMFLFSSFVWGFLLSLQSVILDDLNTNIYRGFKMRFILLMAVLFENFGYRQFTLFYRIRGTFRFLTGDHGWGRIRRKGFTEGAAS
jgi:cellulose synthase/poly-beta-1,6-N-acetylglucosamine synthase-like glycosyltransferase